MTSFTLTRKVDLPAEKVWEIVGDFTKSPGPGVLVEVEKQGDPNSYGIGAVRTITIGKVRVRERLESVDPPKSFTYTILSGAPIKNYSGKAEFIPKGLSTEIRWSGEFSPKIPFTGWICCKVSKGAVNGLIDEIEKTASSE